MNGESYRLATSKKAQRRPVPGAKAKNTKHKSEGDLATKT